MFSIGLYHGFHEVLVFTVFVFTPQRCEGLFAQKKIPRHKLLLPIKEANMHAMLASSRSMDFFAITNETPPSRCLELRRQGDHRARSARDAYRSSQGRGCIVTAGWTPVVAETTWLLCSGSFASVDSPG